MKYAEKKYRKFNIGKIPWSPEVTFKLRAIEQWTLVAKRLRGCKVSARTILRKKKAAKYSGQTNVNHEEACRNLTESYKQYREVIKESTERRTTFINDLEFAQAEAGNSKQLMHKLKKEKYKEVHGRGYTGWMDLNE